MIAQAVRDAGLDPAELVARAGTVRRRALDGGDARAELERELGLTAVSFYGLSEMCGPGVAAECPARDGLHVQEDHFLVEVVDPDSGEPLGEGEQGELVFTTLAKEALPLIRYRTGDIGVVTARRASAGARSRAWPAWPGGATTC